MGLKIKPLNPHPVAPWQPEIAPLPQRLSDWPDDVPLDHEEVKSALWHARGNIKGAAQILRTPPARLGALVRHAPDLGEIRTQAAELVLDLAEAVVVEALEDEDPLRKDSTARFVLEKAGRQRGWTKDGQTGLAMTFDAPSGKAGAIAVRWLVDE